MRFASTLLISSAALLVQPAAHAFGTEGHDVVALIAQQFLSADAKTKIAALLALEPGETLVTISTWADRTRDKATAAWHYVNLPRDANCEYAAARDCPGGDCVVGAIEAQVQRLASNAAPAERLEALKFVVHFVGDVHQPLHAGFADDKGGNTYQLQAFGRGTNLHAVWDTALIHDIDPSAQSLAKKLIAKASASPAPNFAPAQWASESCKIVSRPDFYPARTLPAEYLTTFEPVVEQRLYLAGLRLAATLNQALAASSSR